MSELTAKTIAELRDGIRGGQFKAREVAEAYNQAVSAAKLLNAYTVETSRFRPGYGSACGHPAGHQGPVCDEGRRHDSRQPHP